MKKVLILFLSLLAFSGYSQGPNCNVPEVINPFCAGDESLTFPGVSGGSGAGNMASIGCLGSTPNPMWYYMQIDDPGDLTISLGQISDATGNGIDVDFIIWGPFESVEDAQESVQNNPTNGIVDCSYSAVAFETIEIPSAQTGEIYLVLITNYNGSPGQISLQQTGGVGSTNCEIVCGVSIGGPYIICENQSQTIVAVF